MDHRSLDMAISLADAPLKQMMLVAVATAIGADNAEELKLESVFDCSARQVAMRVGEWEYSLAASKPVHLDGAIACHAIPDSVYKVFDGSITLLSPVVVGILNAWLARHQLAADLTIRREEGIRWCVGGVCLWLDAQPAKN